MLIVLAFAAAAALAPMPDRRPSGGHADVQTADAAQPSDMPPPDMPQGSGPRATSGGHLFDAVAIAQAAETSDQGISVAAANIAPGSFVEVTELGGGHTILALVAAEQAPNGTVLLSPAAMQALGIGAGAGVRVRAALPSPQDQTALRAGAAAGPRIDAPEVLLKALRKRVPQYAAIPIAPVRTKAAARSTKIATVKPEASPRPTGAPEASPPKPTRPSRQPAPVLRSGFVVQVAALSAEARASALARTLGGRVVGGGGLYRVQLGPYADSATAKRARDDASRRGYRDARVAHTE